MYKEKSEDRSQKTEVRREKKRRAEIEQKITKETKKRRQEKNSSHRGSYHRQIRL